MEVQHNKTSKMSCAAFATFLHGYVCAAYGRVLEPGNFFFNFEISSY